MNLSTDDLKLMMDSDLNEIIQAAKKELRRRKKVRAKQKKIESKRIFNELISRCPGGSGFIKQ